MWLKLACRASPSPDKNIRPHQLSARAKASSIDIRTFASAERFALIRFSRNYSRRKRGVTRSAITANGDPFTHNRVRQKYKKLKVLESYSDLHADRSCN
jgi:hypothetical protein